MRGIDPSYDLPYPQQNRQDKESHFDDFIQTLLFPEQMERKLAGIRDGARTALSEIGVNILYIALGYLEWYENDSSDTRFFAPLLLHPLEMERRLIRHTYRYSVTSTGDDSEVNLTLKERLLADFGLALPDFNAEEGDTPEHYWIKVEEAIHDRQRWRIRRFVTIGLFAFGRLAMYHDLDPERWLDDQALHLHPVLVELLGGSDSGGALYAQDYDVDQPEIAAKVPLLVTEADSSQFAAIADVMDGKNLVIKGPPGTGKSQTITNIIAAALAKGMKLLFVAEKMAALEVVKKRLDDAGLGEFCLELHSTKARKQDVLTSLRKRLELQPLLEPLALTDTIGEHERLRKQLTWYVELINQPFGQTGKSLQQLFWAGMRAGAQARELGVPANLDDVILTGTFSLTTVDLDRRREALAALEKCATAFLQTYGTTARHPWAGMPRADLSPFAQQELLRTLEAWREALLNLEKEAERIETELGLPAPTTLDETHRLVRTLALLPEDTKAIAADVLPKLQSEEALSKLEQFCGMVQRWKELKNSFTNRFQSLDRLPEAEVIRTLETERHTFTVDGQPFTGKISELAVIAKSRHEFARMAEAHIALARHLFQSADIRAALTVPTLRTVLEAIEILRSTPRTIVLKRSAALLDETSRPVLEEAARETRLLSERQQALSTILPSRLTRAHRTIAGTLQRCAQPASLVAYLAGISNVPTLHGAVPVK
jgi:hypothetical protein